MSGFSKPRPSRFNGISSIFHPECRSAKNRRDPGIFLQVEFGLKSARIIACMFFRLITLTQILRRAAFKLDERPCLSQIYLTLVNILDIAKETLPRLLSGT